MALRNFFFTEFCFSPEPLPLKKKKYIAENGNRHIHGKPTTILKMKHLYTKNNNKKAEHTRKFHIQTNLNLLYYLFNTSTS